VVARDPSGSARAASPSGTVEVDALLSGARWGGGADAPTTVTYSFPGDGAVWADGYGVGEPFDGFAPLGGAQQAAARRAFAAWSDVADIRFVEVEESAEQAGQIRIANSAAPPTAWSYLPAPGAEGGDVWLHPGLYTTAADGSNSLFTMIHEVGHAIGLKHPHQGPGPTLAGNIDAVGNTVMSYRSFVGDGTGGAYTNDFFPTTPGALDIAAAQHLYGVNEGTRGGDTTYRWAPDERLFQTIWDGGGEDTIDWSNQDGAAVIRLGAGQWSALGPPLRTAAGSDDRTVRIADGVRIEHAIGGRADDRIVGNAADNRLQGGGGDDVLRGRGGGDTFVIAPGSGMDTVEDFQPGIDRVGLDGGLRFADLVFAAGDGLTISAGDEPLVRLMNVGADALSASDFALLA
jgi:serralysin